MINIKIGLVVCFLSSSLSEIVQEKPKYYQRLAHNQKLQSTWETIHHKQGSADITTVELEHLPQELPMVACRKEDVKVLYTKEYMESLKLRHVGSPGTSKKDLNRTSRTEKYN